MVSSIAYQETEELTHSLSLLLALRQHWDIAQDRTIESAFAGAFVPIALECLRRVPQWREECVGLLQFVLMYGKENHLLEQLPLKGLLHELLYLLSEIPALRPSILSLMQVMLEEARLGELSVML